MGVVPVPPVHHLVVAEACEPTVRFKKPQHKTASLRFLVQITTATIPQIHTQTAVETGPSAHRR